MIPVLVALGGVSAHLAARRHPRDELRIESETRDAAAGAPVRLLRPAAGGPRLGLAGRPDAPRHHGAGHRSRAWSASPAICDWPQLTILPGLVASGGALLFGVNAWCLEARGVLWRESLPVDPATVFAARVVVLMEFLLLSSGFTIVLASLRAGVPSAPSSPRSCRTWLVVTMQVVSASMRWSAKRPFAVDLRSARATPAPPAVMVGYSSRLAVSTTLTSLIFSGPGPAPRVADGRPDRHPVPRRVHRPGAEVAGGLARPRRTGADRLDRRRLTRCALPGAPRAAAAATAAAPSRVRPAATRTAVFQPSTSAATPGPAPACVATVTKRVIPQAAPR